MPAVVNVKRGDVQDVLYDLLRELKEDIKLITQKIDRIEIQTTKTNGRVTTLEERFDDSGEQQKFANEQGWRLREFIAKYGVQIGTLFISAVALYLSVRK